MYTHVYIYVYICIHIYTSICIYIHICIHINTCINMYRLEYIYVCMCKLIYIYMYVYICKCIYIKIERESMSKLYGCFDDLSLDPELQIIYIPSYIYSAAFSTFSYLHVFVFIKTIAESRKLGSRRAEHCRPAQRRRQVPARWKNARIAWRHFI